jgi:hypothetical protein
VSVENETVLSIEVQLLDYWSILITFLVAFIAWARRSRGIMNRCSPLYQAELGCHVPVVRRPTTQCKPGRYCPPLFRQWSGNVRIGSTLKVGRLLLWRPYTMRTYTERDGCHSYHPAECHATSDSLWVLVYVAIAVSP